MKPWHGWSCLRHWAAYSFDLSLFKKHFFCLPSTSSAVRLAFTLISINYNFITSTHCSFTCLSYCNTVSVIILSLCVRTFVCKQYFLFTHSPLLFTINHLHYGGKKGRCFNSVFDSFSKHHFFTLWKKKKKKKKSFSMYMVQSILIYVKQFLCNAHLNFGNSTHKFLHINQFMFSFFPAGGSPWILSLL